MQVPDAAKLNLPVVHDTAVAVIEPCTHAYPAVQSPLHDAEGSPSVAPYFPAAHMVQSAAPASLYEPMGQMFAVGMMDPKPQLYPAVHGPEHVEVVMRVASPKCPESQLVHELAPVKLNLPMGQIAAVELVEPSAQA